MEGPARLTIVGDRASFGAFWEEMAGRLGLELRRIPGPEPVRESASAAVVLVVSGREERALERLHEAHRAGLRAPIVVGSEPDHRLAVELMRRGAAGYYALPPDAAELEAVIADRLGAAPEGPAVPEASGGSEGFDFGAILGDAPALRAALDRAARVIPGGRATVLISGETGTGKELLARAIHANGPRAREPFVAVNCSAIPPSLLESELFGHEKGAFTDATAAKPGLFQVADGGTLFLDEVATLPFELQAKLLRVLETGEVRRVGGVALTHVDVRILAAANVELGERVREGAFREDLYFRLAVVPVELPPLRERGGDLRLLARHFLAKITAAYGLPRPELSEAAWRTLERHPWPGNIRELRNAIERGVLLSGGAPIRPEHLALHETALGGSGAGRPGSGGGELPFPCSLQRLEEAAARAMLTRCEGNKSEAARRLGITRSRLYRILKRSEPADAG